MWRRSPLLLSRYPSVFVAIAVAAAVLALATASSPLFLASAGDAALHNELALLTDETAGVQVAVYADLQRRAYGDADRFLAAEAAGVQGLGAGIRTVRGADVTLLQAEGEDGPRVRLFARDGAISHLQVVERAPSPDGVWVAASVAE